MANQYFQNFPELQYKLSNGKIVSIKDFFRKSKIEQEAVDSIVQYTRYEIQDGERPDIVASKLYGDGDLHWTFYLVNDFDNYYDWHKDNETFEKYISQKYAGVYAIASNTTDILSTSTSNTGQHVVSKFLLGEKVTSISGTGNVIEVDSQNKRIAIEGRGFVSGETITGKISNKTMTPTSIIEHRDGVKHYYNKTNGLYTNVPTAGYTSVTLYDYEYELNEEKRLIKVIDPAIIQKVVRRFEKVMSS
jgi:hypothetical protein